MYTRSSRAEKSNAMPLVRRLMKASPPSLPPFCVPGLGCLAPALPPPEVVPPAPEFGPPPPPPVLLRVDEGGPVRMLGKAPVFFLGTLFSFMRSVYSKPLAIDHWVTLPSVEMDTKGSSCSGPRSIHLTFHTGSECFPEAASLSMEGVPCLCFTSYTATAPLYRPRARMFGAEVEKSRAVTPDRVSNHHKGNPGFFRLQNATKPP
mmetsp:Transcript_11991/g.32803  ORF Transcript_11991/g.32803 Transcript_11991/m.32803 type:complete len:205 (-) Transcript_11991:41-655(-)